MTEHENDAATIKTAEDFAREQREKAAQREYALRQQELRERTSRVLAMVWGPAVTLIALGLFVWIGYIVHQVSTEHVHEHDNNVTVWCYADPNTNSATSEFTGPVAKVKGICPDASRTYSEPGNVG